MPRETFRNLNADKREQFLEAAFLEFAERDYQSASVSRIVMKLGIAKGSVYQYFEDKQDLYRYLLEVASSRKLEFIRERADASAGSGDFFEVHRDTILAGAAFDFQNPRYGLLILNALKERRTPELGALADDLGRRSRAFLRDYVRSGVEKGMIRSDLDAFLVAEFVSAVSLMIGPYMEEKYGFSLVQQLRHPELSLPFSEAQLRNEVDALVDVVRRGIEVPTEREP